VHKEHGGSGVRRVTNLHTRTQQGLVQRADVARRGANA
jgi:hypothetical protein